MGRYDWITLGILTPHWLAGAEEVPSLETVRSKASGSVMRDMRESGVMMRDLSVVSPPIPDIVARSVTGPGETSLLGVIRSGGLSLVQLC